MPAPYQALHIAAYYRHAASLAGSLQFPYPASAYIREADYLEFLASRPVTLQAL